MLFTDALTELQKGNYVTRHGWNDGSYLALLPSMLYVWKVSTNPNPAAGNWLPLMQDMLADDWQLLEQVKCGEFKEQAPAEEAPAKEELPAAPEAA